MKKRKRYAYHVKVLSYPDEPNLEEWCNYHHATVEFSWPRERSYLSIQGAQSRLKLFEDLGAKAIILKSEPLAFPSVAEALAESAAEALAGLAAMEVEFR